MANSLLPNLPEEIISNIIDLVGQDSATYLGPFMMAGKLGYELVYNPCILQRCKVTPIVDASSCQICDNSKFREFFKKCVEVGNIEAVYYEGLHHSTSVGLEAGIKVLEANVPSHGLSTLAVGIFYLCLGKSIESNNVFHQFAVNHGELKCDAISEMGDELKYRLIEFHAPSSHRYKPTLIFPEDDVLTDNEKCFLGHEYFMDRDGGCKKCRLIWATWQISLIM